MRGTHMMVQGRMSVSQDFPERDVYDVFLFLFTVGLLLIVYFLFSTFECSALTLSQNDFDKIKHFFDANGCMQGNIEIGSPKNIFIFLKPSSLCLLLAYLGIFFFTSKKLFQKK